MTDCINAQVRDMLPDLANGRLSAVEATHVREHIAGCEACAAEYELVRTVRALRPSAVPVNVAAIVAALPKPALNAAAHTPSVVSLDAHRAKVAAAKAPATVAVSGWRARNVWKIAAVIGFMVVGGWSVVMLQPGGVPALTATNSDSVRLADAAERAARAGVTDSELAANPSLAMATEDASGAAVSFGDVGGYTDEELQRVLDRLDQWDGATSTEAITTAPILPLPAGGSPDDN